MTQGSSGKTPGWIIVIILASAILGVIIIGVGTLAFFWITDPSPDSGTEGETDPLNLEVVAYGADNIVIITVNEDRLDWNEYRVNVIGMDVSTSSTITMKGETAMFFNYDFVTGEELDIRVIEIETNYIAWKGTLTAE
ncbi:MAG: hypothetical protein JW939_01725 [Candidatus Thermoplasmatota archaeon]|nr:hypothetical protein [Candidatus Thermoplasmatota archaeon]